MNCAKARERMLIAERSELRGDGGGALARHLRGCARCRAIAARIDEETARLAHVAGITAAIAR